MDESVATRDDLLDGIRRLRRELRVAWAAADASDDDAQRWREAYDQATAT